MPMPSTIVGDDTLPNCLVSGGDDRLDCNPVTGLNMYGYGPHPRPQDFAFSSSTASTISTAAFAHVEGDYARIIGELENQSPADLYAREMTQTRADLLHMLDLGQGSGLPGVDAIMAASGTDIHLFAATLLAQQDPRTLMTITLKGSETGSGVMTASAGRHFMGRVSSGRSVIKGEQLSSDRSMRHMSINVRGADGSLRTEQDVERDLRGEIELVRAAGMRCLLVITDVSKTGLIAPGLETALRLKAHFGAMLEILVDACQLRISTATIQAYLTREFLVAITGSKFLAGPIFCGALLCPPELSQRLKLLPLPKALADYSTKADWPDDWAARRALPARANFGLLLRWKAALFELEQFLAIPPERIAAIMSAFAKAVTTRIEGDNAFTLLDTRPIDRSCLSADPTAPRWDEIPSVFSFQLRSPDGRSVLTTEEATAVYKNVAVGQGDLPAIRLGQPVSTGDQDGQPTSALRICLSAPLIVQASRSSRALGEIISQAMTALDRAASEAGQMGSARELREARYI